MMTLLELRDQRSKSILAKDSQAMIPYKLFSHLEALEPIIREI